MHEFIKNYWLNWFPELPSYQTFVLRLNQLEPSFQTIESALIESLASAAETEIDSIIDSPPVMLAQHGHSYSAKVSREIAAAGFCAAEKTRFHGVRLHFIAKRRNGKLPVPKQIWLCSAAHHDSLAFKGQAIDLPATALFGDLAFADKKIAELLKEQATEIITPKKKPKDKELTEFEKYHNRLFAKFRQPIQSLFNWINEKTGIQKAGKVRSTDGLMIHCWGKLIFAFWLLVFNY